jgi:hypothetical protein
MSEKFSELSPELINFIGEQHIYFVGTAGAEGRVNVSPKGMDSLRVLGSNDVIWLNMTDMPAIEPLIFQIIRH